MVKRVAKETDAPVSFTAKSFTKLFAWFDSEKNGLYTDGFLFFRSEVVYTPQQEWVSSYTAINEHFKLDLECAMENNPKLDRFKTLTKLPAQKFLFDRTQVMLNMSNNVVARVYVGRVETRSENMIHLFDEKYLEILGRPSILCGSPEHTPAFAMLDDIRWRSGLMPMRIKSDIQVYRELPIVADAVRCNVNNLLIE